MMGFKYCPIPQQVHTIMCSSGTLLTPVAWDLLVHAALCYFFPSYIGLQFSLNMMLNGIKRIKRKLSEKLSGKELTDFLQDAVRNEKVFATARIEAAKAKSKSMMGNQYRKNSKKPPGADPAVSKKKKLRKTKLDGPAINGKRKLPSTNSKFTRNIQYAQRKRLPPSTDPTVNRHRETSSRTHARNRLIALGKEIPPELQVRRSCNNSGSGPLKTEVSKSAEDRRLGRQRAKLRKNGEKVFTGAFSNAEVDLYIESYPDAIFVYHCPSSDRNNSPN